MSRTSRRKRGPVRAKKVIHDGIKFASGLEKYMYIVLKEAKIKAKYEGQSYELVPSFSFNNKSYERQANSKGEYRERGGKKIRAITYTQTLLDADLSLSVKEELMNLFQYAGNYLKDTYRHITLTSRYINHKLKKNAKKP